MSSKSSVHRSNSTKHSNNRQRPQPIQRQAMGGSSAPKPADMQKRLGNQGTQAWLAKQQIQTKLTVGQPGDKYEQEADRTAEAVMRMPDPMKLDDDGTKVQAKPVSDKLQRTSSAPVTTLAGTSHIQRICVECEKQQNRQSENNQIQKKENNGEEAEVTTDIKSNIDALEGKGSPLPDSARNYFEPRFGADFSQVRVHTDTQASQTAKSLNARAFTVGNNIVFGQGQFAPNSHEGQRLMGHELTHMVQQGGDGVQRKCKDCGILEEKNEEPVIRTKPNTSVQTFVQRAHIENGRRKFDCPDFVGDAKLEACLNDEDRLRPFDTGASVTKIQTGLQKDGLDLGVDGTKGAYGADTGKAVMAFKQKHSLGSTQFPDVGPGTTKKLDELCVVSPKPPTRKPTKPKPPSNCGPGTADPFCLGIPSPDSPCKPFPSGEQGLLVWESLRDIIPSGAAVATLCGEVKTVWDTYFAATSIPFSFSESSSCVVSAAKTDPEGSGEANRIANGHLEDIIDRLPITLQGITPSPFSVGGPVAERRLLLEEAVGPFSLHHPSIIYNNPFNAAANLVGATGTQGEGSDIFGDDDRLISGPVVIEVATVDPESGAMAGQVRWQPHIHVKDTVDFCPGNLGNSAQTQFTVPMSKLESMGLTRDVPITIDYDLDVRQSNFNNVQPLIGPPPPLNKRIKGLDTNIEI